MKLRKQVQPASPFAGGGPEGRGGGSPNPSRSRKSRRPRSSPSRYVARPSRQGLGVEEGDLAFLEHGGLRSALRRPGAGGDRADDGPPRGRPFRARGGDAERGGGDATTERPPRPATPSRPPHKQPPGGGAPRKPRVIVVGAGISGLAAARELSERRHDVLVLEARNRLGGRLRTVDLMLDKEWEEGAEEAGSDLRKVRRWSPVDVGGAFIHGTGASASDAPPGRAGSHDFGVSGGGGRARAEAVDSPQPVRKSERLDKFGRKRSYEKMEGRKDYHIRRSQDGIGSLNPLYVLARQKLRLAVHPAKGEYTCLVDHHGNSISEEVDQSVAKEFDEVLDLATRSCELGRYEWKERHVAKGESASTFKNTGMGDDGSTTAPPSLMRARAGSVSSDASRSPNYVSDDTADNAKISPETDFGEIFEECKRHHEGKSAKRNRNNAFMDPKERKVRDNLFQWHVANLEMSSGAPMNRLGQRWNDDEPFGYGGDHSYLRGGLRDVVEALAEGFDCRGVGDRSLFPGAEGAGLRRSGDFASTLGGCAALGHSDATGGAAGSRGIIQCGIEVNGIRVVENEEAKRLRRKEKEERKKRNLAPINESSLRRSNRDNRGSKMTLFLDALSSRSKWEHTPLDESANSASGTTNATLSTPASSYGNNENSRVQITTKCGLALEADAVVVTTPLAILSIPPGEPGHISFSPPLPLAKQNALSRLGVGAYNKCCMSFEKPFWDSLPRHLLSASTPGGWADKMTKRFDFLGHASAEHGKDILFFNLRDAPVLVAIYGGSEYSQQIEGMHDGLVVSECMKVLKKVCGEAIRARDVSLKTRRQVDLTVPDWPIDYFVSRWGSDPYSRGAFCYVPPGVNGFEELRAMSAPIYDFCNARADGPKDRPKRPLVMFAGEATTPYHPSTMHGAFESGIREAYRLDLALEPDLSGITFDESFLYQPTFSIRRGPADPKSTAFTLPETSLQKTRNGTKNDLEAKSWWFDHDASILRGVETFGCSRQTMSTIKAKMLAPANNNHSVKEMQRRYKTLMHMIANEAEAKEAETPKFHSGTKLPPGVDSGENEWNIPGGRGSWLAAGVVQNLKRNVNAKLGIIAKAKQGEWTTRKIDSQTRRSSRKTQKKVDESFAFY